MFQDYIAKKQDLEAIEKAIAFVNKPEMKFVFSDYSRIKKTLIVSYDSKRIYYWGLNGKSMFTVPHDLKITDNWQ